MAASLGAKPSGCTETLIMTMAPETTLYFIINTTHTDPTPHPPTHSFIRLCSNSFNWGGFFLVFPGAVQLLSPMVVLGVATKKNNQPNIDTSKSKPTSTSTSIPISTSTSEFQLNMDIYIYTGGLFWHSVYKCAPSYLSETNQA